MLDVLHSLLNGLTTPCLALLVLIVAGIGTFVLSEDRMKKILLVLACLSVSSGFGANVVWGEFKLSNANWAFESGEHRNLGYDGYTEIYGLCPSVGFSVTKNGGQVVLSAEPDTVMLSFYGTWCLADYGDLVSSDATFGSTQAFFDAGAGQPGWRSDYDVIIKNGESVYLSVACKIYGEEQTTYSGWVELANNNGQLSLLASALDLDGGPMIVGGGSASPEPSSALLLLLGAGVLGLRRRRKP